MTTDPIAAARTMIEPLTRYTPRPWSHHKCLCGHRACNQYTISTQGGVGFRFEDARLIVASPDLREMVATLADALEAERAERERAESAETEYRRKNHRLMVEMEQAHAAAAAAYEAAALFSESQRREGDSFYNDGWCACATVVAGGIRNITPSDAQAALDKLLAEARLEGWRAGRDAAADEAKSCTHDPHVVRAISALPEPKETSHDD